MPITATFDELIAFLDYLADKGLMKEQTVAPRKAAANKVFEALSDEDRANVLAVNLSEAMTRFINKSGNSYSPGSLQTYQSRLKSTLDDFRAYKENPMGFRPSVSTRSTKKSSEGKPPNSGDAPLSAPGPAGPPTAGHGALSGITADILPIPLRVDLTVRIQGLPFDLSEAEANKIATIIRAYVSAS